MGDEPDPDEVEGEDEAKQVGHSTPPPPPPDGFDLPPPPMGVEMPPPPPPGLDSDDSSDSGEPTKDEFLDHDSARDLLLSMEGVSESDEQPISELPEVAEESALDPPPPPAGFEAPPPPPGFGDSVEDEDEHGEGQTELDPPPPPAGFEAPPPPPGFGDSVEDEGDQGGQTTPDISSIDSLADSLSLLDGGWGSDETLGTTTQDQEIANPDSGTSLSWPIQEKIESSEESEVAQAIDAFGLVKESQFTQTDSSRESRPSPFLRNAPEVDSIPGDKLHATLSENEKSVLNPDGSIRKQFIDGELILRNSSKKHRAWDIEVHLESIDSTDFGDKVSTIKELDPTEEAAIPYTASGPRMLVLNESIDTEISRGEEPSVSLVFSENPQDIEITIEIENVSPVPLFDVEVKRTIPESFILPEDSVYSIEKKSVVWDIGRMNIGEKRTLSVSGKVSTGSVEKINAGVTSATYSAEATVSRARFDRVHGSGRQFSYVNAEEDDRPGVWHCTCVFENKSSFVVSLSGATVRLIGREEPILDVSDIRQDVPPEGRWDSMVKRVESENQPSFTQEIRFSILPRVSVESTGTVELKEQQLTVLDAALQKRYDKSRIKSYVSSKVEAVVTLENTGTSEINVIRILDDIPGLFETPSAEDVVIEMDGAELQDDQYRIDIVNGIQLEEKHISPDNDGHGLRITIGTSAPLGLMPGKTVLIRYPLDAPDPSPRNEMLVAPIKVDFSSERFGPVATRAVERPPMIKVVHKRRNISTGKEVFPGGKPGQYEIMLMFHNNSDSALEDLALHDIVPGTFSIEKSTIRSDKDGEREASTTKESARDGTQVTWAIGRILQDERIEVLYTIQGDPEAEYKVSDAQDFHGATFGEEVDEEPNIPEWVENVNKNLHTPSPESLDLPLNEESEEVSDDPSSQDEISEDPKENDEESEEEEVPSEEPREEPESETKNKCPACGFEMGIGSSICMICGNTL